MIEATSNKEYSKSRKKCKKLLTMILSCDIILQVGSDKKNMIYLISKCSKNDLLYA